MADIEELITQLPGKAKISLDDITRPITEDEKQSFTEEQKNIIKICRDYIESKLFLWDKNNFTEFQLPKTVFKDKIKDKLPTFNQYESKQITYESPSIVGQSFTPQMLKTIWERGEFEVKSLNKELPYTWRISSFIIKGQEKINQTLNKDFAKSFEAIYTFPKIFSLSHLIEDRYNLEIFNGIYNLFLSFYNMLDLIIGLPTYEDKHNEITLEVTKEKLKEFITSHPEFNFKIFDSETRSSMKFKIVDMQASENYNKKYKEDLKKYKEQKLTENQINKLKYEDMKVHILEYINGIKEYQNIKKEYKDIDDFINAQQIINDENLNEIKNLDDLNDKIKKEIDSHLIKKQVYEWVKDMKDNEKINLQKDKIKLDKENIIKEKIQKYKIPKLIYDFNNKLKAEVPGLVEEKLLSLPKEGLFKILCCVDLTQPYEVKKEENSHYKLIRKKVITLSSRFIFWRIYIYIVEYFIDMWNFVLTLFRGIFTSCFGIRALYTYDLYTDVMVDDNGIVHQCSKTFTYPKTLSNIKNWSFNSIKEFESAPDTGIFSKKLLRIFVYLFNIVFKLCIIGGITLVGYPVSIILNILFRLLLIIISPLVVLIFEVFKYLFEFFIYGIFRHGYVYFPFFVLIKNLILYGIIQIIGSLIYIILKPLLAIYYFNSAITRYFIRDSIDTYFYFVIKKCGKIPISDSFIAHIKSGPNVFDNYYSDISNKDIIIFSRKEIELKIIDRYQMNMKYLLNEPQRNIAQINKFFNNLNLDFENFMRMSDNINFFMDILDEQIRKRIKIYPKLNALYNVRFNEERLKQVINLVKLFIERYNLDSNISYLYDEKSENKEEDLAKIILKRIFGKSILVPLSENDKVVTMEEQYTSIKDVIAESILCDPYFKNQILRESPGKKEANEKYIKYPKIAMLGDVFNGELNITLNVIFTDSELQKLKVQIIRI